MGSHPDKNDRLLVERLRMMAGSLHDPDINREDFEDMDRELLMDAAARIELLESVTRLCCNKAAPSAIEAPKESAYEKARRTRLTEDPCKCGLMKVPVGIDGVSWYWQRHSREECTLELPNSLCSCGLLRSEHLKGHKGDDAVRRSDGGADK